VRGYGLSSVQRPLTRFAAQIDLSPLGRGELNADKPILSRTVPRETPSKRNQICLPRLRISARNWALTVSAKFCAHWFMKEMLNWIARGSADKSFWPSVDL
jgi:hypothetical protein